ncbi:MAG: hypothetical protein ACLSHU_04255 [Oscillospiraceae bacterium]
MNVVTYEVNIQIGEPLPAPDMIAFDSSANSWIGFGRNDDLTTAQTLSTSKETFLAATDVDGMIFASTAEGDLYVLNEEDPSEATYVTNLGVILTDMAYNSETGILYGVTDNQLVTVDKLLGYRGDCGRNRHHHQHPGLRQWRATSTVWLTATPTKSPTGALCTGSLWTPWLSPWPLPVRCTATTMSRPWS